MIRCSIGGDRVGGFDYFFIKALIEPPPDGPNSYVAQPAVSLNRRLFRSSMTLESGIV